MRAAKRRSFAFFFVALALLVSSPAFASIPRSAALDPPAIDRYALVDDLTESSGVLPLRDQLARAARVSWPVESLPETRIGVSLDVPPLFTEPTPLLTRALHRAYADLCATNASGRTLCAGDPVNCSDPRGEARKTKNGGVNSLGDWGDDTDGGMGFWAITKNTVGNTLSDLFMLDAVADNSMIVGDSTRDTGERFAAGGKLAGIVLINVAGGEVAGTAGKVLLKVPGAKTVVARVAESAVGRVLATDVKVLASQAFDRVAGSTAEDVVRAGLTRPTARQLALHERINARGRLAEYKASLPTRNAQSTVAGQYQTRVLGTSTEREAFGGGVKYWADDIRLADFSLNDAKMIPNPARSPSIPGSAIPARFRTIINAQAEDEFSRISSIIADPSNELRQLNVITSNTRAVAFWEELMQKLSIPGKVRVRP